MGKGITDFNDKTAMVTGAASGIGRALAIELAREGAHLVAVDVNHTGLEEVAEDIKGMKRKALAVKTDVSNPEEVKDLCNRALEEMGGVDILANVAGIGIAADIEDMGVKDWRKILGVNLMGPIHTVTYLINHMTEHRSGHIVNVASGCGLVALPTLGGYNTSKFGLVGFSETLRAEAARFKVGVTVVCPGAVRTNIFSSADYKKYDLNEPLEFTLKHFGWTPERIARSIIKGIRKNRPMMDLTPMTWLGYRVKRLSPSLMYFMQRWGSEYLVRYKNPGLEG